ncbi:MAG: FHA domain-containing protein [Ruminococcus sp.]|nr:FHA domain-containing protein [Ruminococcus sp.]
MGKWYLKNESGKSLYVFEENDPYAELDNVTLSMLINNEIPSLIPCSFSQMDQTRFIKFNISSKLNAFKEYMDRQTTFSTLSGLLINTCRAFIELKKYMIDINSLILDTDKMYIDMSMPIAMFVVDPILSEDRRVDLQNFFTNIVVGVNLADGDRRYVGDILALLRNRNFSLEKFVDALEDLRQPGAARPAPEVREQVYERNVQSSIPQNREQNNSYVPEQRDEYISSTPAPPEQEDNESGSWKDKLLEKLKSKPPKAKKPEKAPKKGKQPEGFSGIAIPGQEDQGPVIPASANIRPSVEAPKPVVKPPVEEKRIPAPSRQVEDYVAPVVKGVDDNDTTQIMDSYENGEPRLIRQRTQEIIDIDKDTFNLGRDPKELLDYVINDARVSRKHASIIFRDDVYYIVDRGSRNHTYLNGKMLIPNAETPLSSGDVIKLGSEEFIFEI